MIGQATGAVSSTGASLIIPHSLHALSDALLKVGMAERALVVSQQALEEIDRNGQELFRAEHLRFKAEAAMRLGDRAAAMADLQKALETAKAHAAAWVQLRCAIAFARAQRGSGEQNTARVMLIDARSRLQEGFETPDFREATNLLQELA